MTSRLLGFGQKNLFSWFRVGNLGLILDMARIFYRSVAKGLKIKIRKFWMLIPTFGEVLGETLVGGWGFGHL